MIQSYFLQKNLGGFFENYFHHLNFAYEHNDYFRNFAKNSLNDFR